MSDDRRKDEDHGGLPADEDELVAELDQWDAVFDTLHEADEESIERLQRGEDDPGVSEEAAPEETAATAAAEQTAAADADAQPGGDELELADLDDLLGEPQALGELLGQPPPLPPVEGEDAVGTEAVEARPGPEDEPERPRSEESSEDVFTSAPRPDPPPANLAPAPTDDELFADLPEEVDLSAIDVRRKSAAPAEPESTRLADVDADLLAETAGERADEPESTRLAGPEVAQLAERARGPDRPRGPAIVRRDDLERQRREREREDLDDFGDEFGGESTRIASANVMQGLADAAEEDAEASASRAAEELFAEEPPEPVIELDEDFYDGIEIDEAGRSTEAAPEATPPTETGRRRTTAHIIRRRPKVEPPSEDEGVVMEIEAEPSEAFEAPTPAEGSRSAEGEIELGDALAQLRAESEAGRARAEGAEPSGEVEPEPSGEVEPEPSGEVEPEAELDIEAVDESAVVEEVETESPEASPPAVELDVPPAAAEVEPEPVAVESLELPEEEAPLPPDEGAALPEVDVAPELPPPVFGAEEPGLELDALTLPEAIDVDAVDRTEEMALQLLLYERELERLDEPASVAEVRFEAGRLAEQLGDLDRARTHYQEALETDPRRSSIVRGLRRVERQAGDWLGAIRYLEAELERASDVERRALMHQRLDLSTAVGETEAARAVTAEVLDQDPDDVSALLVRLELAFVDGTDEELDDTLDRLSQALAGSRFGDELAVLRARRDEAAGHRERATERLAAVLEARPTVRQGWWVRARNSLAAGDQDQAGVALAAFDGDAELAEAEPELVAALQWRRGVAATTAVDAGAALELAAQRSPDDPVIAATLAEASTRVAAKGREGAAETAARHLLHLAEVSRDPSERARAAARAARLLRDRAGAPDRAAEVLRQVVATDRTDVAAAEELRAALASAGDEAALEELERQAVQADPAGAVFERARLAERLLSNGNPEGAAAELRSAIASGASSPVLVELLLRALRLAERVDERAELLAELAEGEGEGEQDEPVVARERAARAAEARAYDVVERIERSRAESQAEGRVDAEASETRERARIEARDRAVVDALEAWQRVLDIDPDASRAHAAAVRLAALLGQPDVLEDVLARAQNAERQPAQAVSLALRRLALILNDADPDVGRAEEVLREAQGADPTEPRIALALEALAASTDRWADAAVVLEERAAALGDGAEADQLCFRAAGMMLDQAAEPARAADLLGSVLEHQPSFAPAQEMLQRAHQKLGDPNALAADLERAAAPGRAAEEAGRADSFALLVREAEVYEYQVGDPARACDLYAKAFELRPADPLAREGFARAAALAHEAAPLAELALDDLKDAEERGDPGDKADAYEELARIDLELRGDPASAQLSWESAADADPKRLGVLRRLERAYPLEQRWQDLLELERRIADALGDAPEVAALAAEAGRLAERLEHSTDEVLADYRRAFERDRRQRMALFHLEANERTGGPSAELAALEEAVADYFSSDERARAAFLTRAGETLVALSRIEDGIERFRRAIELSPGYVPALGGWRNAAMAGELWLDLASAARREAEAASTDDDRAALHHLAAVALMDRALEGERAIEALRSVLAVAPAHRDAFVRLRMLYDELGQHEELAQLLAARLEVADEPGARIELHRSLAELHRNFLDDRDGAKHHLRAVLEIDSRNLAAVAALSDIAWEQGSWAEAAEALIGRARLETDPDVLEHVFYRLGTLYADHLPDRRWAIKSFQKVLSFDPDDEGALDRLGRLAMEEGDWGMALGACERRIQLTEAPADKIACLHQVARIYAEGLEDPTRAERAYQVALDVDPTNADALSALVRHYQERGDTSSMRVHLDRVAAPMRKRLAASPLDGVAYRVLARVLEAREQAGVRGSLATARCAAELAILVGEGGDHEQTLAAPVARVRPIIRGLGDPDIDDDLFPRSVSTGLRQLFSALGERIAKQAGVDVRRWGVGRGDRLKRGDDPVVRIAREVAGEMGAGDIELYVSSKDPYLVAVEPTSPPSVIVGSALADAERPAELRFAVGRAVKLALSSFAVADRLSADEFGVLLVALLRQFAPEFVPAGVDSEVIEREAHRMRKLVPDKMMNELRPFALGVAGAQFNHKRIWSGIRQAGHRAGLLASGSARAAVTLLSRQAGHADLAKAATDAHIAELMRFAVSDDHAHLRAHLE